ncbi:MAG: alcohol dehydrogenase catalytic domain-containing protein [Bryobacteraceae bacterium]|nr:alcohol dehydrogenase catalytic domain-containing protein [Bryobacteraceae bacterium]
MKAAGLDYSARRLTVRELPEPEPSPAQVLLEVVEVGVCGTDRELARFHLGFPPAGQDFLTLGHEAVARVVDPGPSGSGLKRGDWVVPQVRRPCASFCASCARGRRDLCLTGTAPDRGITGIHGYLSTYAVDRPEDLVRVPEALLDVAVLIEPMSVVEKSLETALRFHEHGPRTALVLGAGPIGILSALLLQHRGLEVTVASLESKTEPRVRLLERAGIAYSCGFEGIRPADLVVEATGSPSAALAGFSLLAPLGVYAIVGASDPIGKIPLVDMVVKNQVVFGTVNASPRAFELAVSDLAALDRSVLQGMIRRVRFDGFEETILQPSPEVVKFVHCVE